MSFSVENLFGGIDFGLVLMPVERKNATVTRWPIFIVVKLVKYSLSGYPNLATVQRITNLKVNRYDIFVRWVLVKRHFCCTTRYIVPDIPLRPRSYFVYGFSSLFISSMPHPLRFYSGPGSQFGLAEELSTKVALQVLL